MRYLPNQSPYDLIRTKWSRRIYILFGVVSASYIFVYRSKKIKDMLDEGVISQLPDEANWRKLTINERMLARALPFNTDDSTVRVIRVNVPSLSVTTNLDVNVSDMKFIGLSNAVKKKEEDNSKKNMSLE